MRIYLRDINPEDGRLIVKWRNSPRVASHSFNKTTITEESNKQFYENNIVSGKYKQYIVERIDEEFGVASYPIATVYLKDMDYQNNRCELCIFTSDDQEWNSESQSIAVSMLLDKAFNELNMHKVYSYVFAEFLDEAEMLKRAGFTAEAILSNEAKNSCGEYTDVIRFCAKSNK